ncbi:MAG: hypothetical protein H0U75_10645 [Legionella sp.]|nr:hypothetical protein [Legionella sp.]
MKRFVGTIVAFYVIACSHALYSDNFYYKILIDAGSSGSRLHIFQIDESTPVPTINKVFSKSIKPGMSTFGDSPEKVGPEYLAELLDEAEAFLDKKMVTGVEINILATAGMRLIPMDKQEQIFLEVTKYLNNYPFQIGEIKTITGEMEGIYGWLDINYLLHNFQNHTPSVGSIDMGGASTQIAYETTQLATKKDVMTLVINNQQYVIFSKTFSGFGQDKALLSMLKRQQAGACFPREYNFQDEKVGDFDRASCANIYTDMLLNEKIAQQIALPPEQTFFAYSGIYYTFNFFEMNENPNQSLLESKIQIVCSSTWSQLKTAYPKVADKYLSSYCANAVFENELLFNMYRIEGSKLRVENTIEKNDIDWALGAVLYRIIKTNPIP